MQIIYYNILKSMIMLTCDGCLNLNVILYAQTMLNLLKHKSNLHN